MLNVGGYQVVRATSGTDALRVYESNSETIDLAVLDVMMPGMNGVELAGRLREADPMLKILLITGCGPKEMGMVVGDKPYPIIWKPFKTESLLRMISTGQIRGGIESWIYRQSCRGCRQVEICR